MKAVRAALRRLLHWLEPGRPMRPARDQIADTLRAAIAADERAKANNVETYEARVNAMIGDFFSNFEGCDGRRSH